MSNSMQDMMKQAQILQKKMEEVQNKLDATELTGFAGGGSVTVTLSGKMVGRDICIKEDALKTCGFTDEMLASVKISVLEDLILAALNDARSKVETHVQQEMQVATGGFNLPGVNS